MEGPSPCLQLADLIILRVKAPRLYTGSSQGSEKGASARIRRRLAGAVGPDHPRRGTANDRDQKNKKSTAPEFIKRTSDCTFNSQT